MDKTIYVIKNTITKRFYVGTTERPVKYRFEDHLKALKGHRHKVELMQSDYDAYGADSFVCKAFDTYPDIEGRRMEPFMMFVLNSKNPEYGYNYKDSAGTGYGAIKCKLRADPLQWVRKKRPKQSDDVIYRNIKAIADKKGLAITKLEQIAKLGRGTIGKWQKTSPRVDKLQAVAAALGVSISALIEEGNKV